MRRKRSGIWHGTIRTILAWISGSWTIEPVKRRSCGLNMSAESGILQMICGRSYARPWRTNMLKAESPSQYIEQLSALPPRRRLEEFRAIPDPVVRRQVAEGLPPELHGE